MSDVAPPMGMLAELSHRCPQRCVYCSNPLELTRKSEELATDDWKRVLEQAAALGVIHVHLSGGEPTVRRDLEELVTHCVELGLYTNLITSGVLLDEERLRGLADRGLDHIQLSFQGAEQGLADDIAGLDGAQAKKVQCAKWAREAGLRLTINAVVHRQNLHELEDILAMAKELGADRLEVAHAQYQGWAMRNIDALLPTRGQLEEATALVRKHRQRWEGEMEIDYVVPDFYAKYPKACMGGWGRQFLVVDPRGDVLPCHGAGQIDGMAFDNIRDRDLSNIWAESEAFERFRGTGWMPEPCRSCERKERDWGGCRCQAFALIGDAAATDPVCVKSAQNDLVQAKVQAVNEEGMGDDRRGSWVYRSFQGVSYPGWDGT